ncbi:MAG TPA: VOC family protein [Solirubrobacteraceae bacterium]|nr:VOC family protein [Solirubrobacteraceae bacterium]
MVRHRTSIPLGAPRRPALAPEAHVSQERPPPHPVGASPFYSGLFGWTIEPFEGSPEPYYSIKNGDANNGGIREQGQPGTPPHWLVYFAVKDIDAAIAKVEELGGAKMVGPIDIQIAKIAIVHDEQGAFFALYAGELAP